MRINSFNTDDRVLVVAEIGNNHEGNAAAAFRLIDAAADAGVDAVKFQTFQTELYLSKMDRVRYDRLKRFELPWETFPQLAAAAHKRGLLFMSTPFDLESARRLSSCVDAFKIASGDNNFFPLFETLATFRQPTLVSMGLTDEQEARGIVKELRRLWSGSEGLERLAILHCVTAYPTPPEQANLLSIQTLANLFSGTVGYSDHTLGLDACMAAVALGARVIEKHFTLDKAYSDFRDHALSSDPGEMTGLVRGIRHVEELLGSPGKRRMLSEHSAVSAVRRSIVAAVDLERGRLLTPSDLTWIRPGGGMAPGREKELIGRRLSHDVRQGERLTLADLEA